MTRRWACAALPGENAGSVIGRYGKRLDFPGPRALRLVVHWPQCNNANTQGLKISTLTANSSPLETAHSGLQQHRHNHWSSLGAIRDEAPKRAPRDAANIFDINVPAVLCLFDCTDHREPRVIE